MFGDRYFATRERLSVVVRGVQGLAEDTGTEPGPLGDEAGFLEPLNRPFVFLVLGDVNAGKSAFINGLFGEELCETEAVPCTKQFQWFCAKGEEPRRDDSALYRECARDSEILQDFNVVDSPGIQSYTAESREFLDGVLEHVDLVFFIFPVSNAWSAGTWDLISNLAPKLEGKMALVLQQKDQRGEEDMVVMMEHVQELASQKIGLIPPVFPVSGLQALEAKQEESIRDLLWRKSGYNHLESFISHKIALSPTRRESLRTIRDGTNQTLSDIEDRMEERRRTLDSDKGFLSDIETEVGEERARQVERLTKKFSGLGEVFGEQAEKASVSLARRTSMRHALGSLLRKDETPAEIEKSLVDSVQLVVEGLASKDSDELVAACQGHWQTVIPRIEERLEMPPPDFEQESKGFERAREHFANRLGGAARKAVVAQKIRGMLDHEMETHRDVLRRFVTISLLLTTVAGILGALQWNIWALIVLVSALLFFFFGLFRYRRSSSELVEWFCEKSSSCRRPFADKLSEEYEEGVRGFFVEYVSIFEDIRRHVAELTMKLKPQLESWNNHFLELKAIDQEL